MNIKEVEGIIEAILFAMGDSVPLKKLAEVVGLDTKTTQNVIYRMVDNYEAENRGFSIVEFDGSFQMCTNSMYYDYIKVILKSPPKKELTQTLLETLAIIAYKQPISKPQIEEIRGVNADHAVNKLIEYNLICEKGRSSLPGKAIVFGTSDEFLKYFGFKNINALPIIPEMSDEFKEEAENEVNKILAKEDINNG